MSADLSTFLERFRPDGYTCFVGIVPDGTTVAESFNGADTSQAETWIRSQNRARNCYFTANATPPDLRRKPQKKDVTEIAALWSDIDPLDSDGRSWGDERKRLEALADELHALETPPTFITDSGSGIQPLWLLADPIEANPEYRQAAESLCAQIETALGAKGTHNCDRLLRVPGTRNFPNARKRKLGRGETQARLLLATWRRYSWRELENLAARLEDEPPEHAEPVQPGTGTGTADTADLDLPSEPPKPLEPERLKQLRDRHRGLFDLARYDGDQSRQDLAVASLARRLGWPPVDAWRLIIAVRDDQKAYRRDYIERTLGRAYAEHADEDEEDEFTPDAEQQGRTTSSLPVIAILPGKLSERTTAAIGALRTARLQIFDRGGQLVRPVRVANPETLDGVRRPLGALVLRPVEPEWLRLRLAETAVWRKWDRRAHQWRAADPPHDVARTLTAAPDEGAWPYLRAVVRHPVLLLDGQRITGPGYDARTGLLVDAPGTWPPLPDRPTRDHAVEARARLEYLLRFYPWVSDVDRAVALSLFMTALARAVLPAAPGHGTDAPAPGTGKSLLIDAAAILSTGTTAAVMDYGRDRDEATKRLDGMLLAGDAVISIDNIEAAIEGAALCQTLTQTTRRIRPLGASTMVTVPCTALLTMNGNNLTLKGDIVRRVLVCRLDAGCERPELREIPQDLLADVRRQRGELVRDAQTIMAAYIVAGRPKQNLPPLGGFREWGTMVRDALVWSGAKDPVAAMERTRDDDPSRQAIYAALSAWHSAFGTDPTTAAEAIARADPDPDLRKAGAEPDHRLREALEMIALRGNKIDVRALGQWLRVNRDVRAGAFILRRYSTGAQGGAVRWQVVK